jgi:hypothetical protein
LWNLSLTLRQFGARCSMLIRTTYPVDFDHHCRPEFHARQIANFPFADFVRFVQFAPASGANQFLVAPLAANPKLQSLCPLVDLVPVYAVARPSQQFCKVVVSQTASVPKSRPLRNPPLPGLHRIPAQSRFSHFALSFHLKRRAEIRAFSADLVVHDDQQCIRTGSDIVVQTQA